MRTSKGRLFLAVWIAALIAVAVVAAAARSPRERPESTVVALPEPSTDLAPAAELVGPVGPPPTPDPVTVVPHVERIVFSTRPVTVEGEQTAANFFSVSPDGSDVRAASAVEHFHPDTVFAGTRISHRVLDSTTRTHSGCGVGGCASTTHSRTEAGIVATDLATMEEQLLTRGGYHAFPKFSPDGHTFVATVAVAAESDPLGETSPHLALFDRHGELLDVLPRPPAPQPTDYVWSPDGREIALSTAGTAEQAGLWVISVESKQMRELMKGVFHHLDWSPDGSTLSAIKNGDVGYEEHQVSTIWTVAADGSAPPRQITESHRPAYRPSTSECPPRSRSELQASPTPVVEVTGLTWSPDSTRLAATFSAYDDGALYSYLAAVNAHDTAIEVLRRSDFRCWGSSERSDLAFDRFEVQYWETRPVEQT